MALVFSDVLQLDSLFAGKIPVGSIFTGYFLAI
jgi:hypothetical protein